MSIEGFVDIAGKYEYSALVIADFVQSIVCERPYAWPWPNASISNIYDLFDIARKSFEPELSRCPVAEIATYNMIIQLMHRSGVCLPKSITEANEKVKIFLRLTEKLESRQTIDPNDFDEYLGLEKLLRKVAKVGESNQYAKVMGSTKPPEFCYPI